MNLDGPVRVADKAGSGTATVTLSFAAWKEGQVAPTTHSVLVLPAKAAPKAEPVAENLIGTLVHPDRQANVSTLEFSKDGKRLFAAGYPSGVVQIFDVQTYKELRRIETPPGLRGTDKYAVLAPDWKRLYVPVEKSISKPIETNGKRLYRIEYSGSIRVWNLEDGEEEAPLHPAPDSAPIYAVMSTTGNSLVCIERPSFDTDQGFSKDATVVWDLKSRKSRKVADGFAAPVCSPDGHMLALHVINRQTMKYTLRILDTRSFQELAHLECPASDRNFSMGTFSPEGALFAVSLGGRKDAPREIWFRDAKTLADRGRFVAEGLPERNGWGECVFTPDGKYCVIQGVKGRIVLWDIAGKKVAREFPFESNAWHGAVSRDSRTLAVPWTPQSGADRATIRDPDPRDYPQPRITLFDLAGEKQPRTLVAPHGFVGAVAFSPDGKTLAFGTSGGVRLFDLTK